jgi:predicted aspartyl protease
VRALVDCGATSLFVDAGWVQANGIPTRSLSAPVAVYNVDGTLNEAGAIREVVMVILQYGEHKERATFAVTKLGGQDMLLGLTWLRQHNPEIDWRSEEVQMMR